MISAVLAGVHFAQYSATAIEAGGMCVDELVVEPVVLDHQVQNAGEERGITSGLDRQEQIARASDGCDPWILNDDPGALLPGLPEIVRRNRRALGDVRSGDPDDLGANHVGPWIGRTVDPERLLVRRTGAYHAQPTVVIDVRRLQAYACELAHQVGLLRRQTGPAQEPDRRASMCALKTIDLAGHPCDRVFIGHRAEPVGADVSRRTAVVRRSGWPPWR